jgi:hypothetical protein
MRGPLQNDGCMREPRLPISPLKDFLRFYVATSRPQLSNKPTVDSINTVAEWFFAGFTRTTGTETLAEERSDVYDGPRQTPEQWNV